jgi:hypothetical protein
MCKIKVELSLPAIEMMWNFREGLLKKISP